MKGATPLSSVLIAVIIGFAVLFLGFNTYSGILVSNNGTIGSDVSNFTLSMRNASSSFDELGNQFVGEAENPKTNIFTDFAKLGELIVSYTTVGWGAFMAFMGMGDSFRMGLTAIKGSLGNIIDASLFAVAIVVIIIWVVFAILNAKRNTAQAP